MNSDIIIYQNLDGNINIDVRLDEETVWLTQDQMASLFGKAKSTINEHIKHIYEEQELEEMGTMKKFGISEFQQKAFNYYNLDVIISVGYRVKSARGTQFRQWATQRIKDYLVEGVAINKLRLEQKNKEIQVLHDGIRILSRAIEDHTVNNESYAWLHQFSLGLQLLDDYDHETLDVKGNNTADAIYPAMSEYMALVNQMRNEFNSDIFGKIKDGGFDSAVNIIEQGFGELDIYPSIEEKAAVLLYLVVKNHAFIDGNKRIAAACFLLFLERNGILFTSTGQTIISNEALASLTLFIAASKADEMETVKKLLISVLNRNLK